MEGKKLSEISNKNLVEVSIEIEEAVLVAVQDICARVGITVEELIVSFIRFCADSRNHAFIKEWFITHIRESQQVSSLALLDFIHQNADWEIRLAEAPYYIKTKRDKNYVLLKYDQIRSDFNEPLVRECRGIILDEQKSYTPVCVPFFKFGNIGESYAPDIDWSTARIQEKVDGSLIKVWHDQGAWHISSNGEIDAQNANISSALLTGTSRGNLFALFTEAWNKTGLDMNALTQRYTYMFELTSPHNRIVARHAETSVCHIGTRDNWTLAELDIDIGVPKPRVFNFRSIEECVESAKLLSIDEEGYVVVDKNFNRIKVKSPRYVALSHMSQGVTTVKNVVEIIQKNEQAEVLAYFPEFQDVFDKALQRIDDFCIRQEADLAELKIKSFDTRKALAAIVVEKECPACLFNLIDRKAPSAREWLMSRPVSQLLKYIGIDG